MADALEAVRDAFGPMRDDVLGVILYGSHAHGRPHARSDVDVCLVAGPGVEPAAALRAAWTRARLGGRDYDIKVFEELPLYLQGEVLDTGRLVITRDAPALSEYMRIFAKLWDDQARRNRPNEDDMRRVLDARRARG